MLKTLACLLMVLALTLPGHSALLQADKTQIAISGTGIVKAQPDVAYIQVAVERTEKTAAQAQQITAGKMNNILASLEKSGINKDQIETTQVSLRPKYEYVQRNRKFVGYSARNQIRITVEQLKELGRIIDATIAAGATDLNQISFSIKDQAVYKNAALQKAFQNAKEKAETIAAAAGQTLEKIVRIQEAEAQVRPVIGMRAFQVEANAGEAETPIAPGQVEIRGNLTVVYESTPKK
ncbi:SIMPL domain-containing protein [Candidatus Margulisiibacteriota bacterium]